MRKHYQASRRLERAIIELAPAYVATANAPNSWRALKEWASEAEDGDPIPVYDGGCDHTIYSEPRVNHAFRAWHDMLHLFAQADFSPRGERIVSDYHFHILWENRIKYHLDMLDLWAMRADVWGQVLYYQKHKEYVTDQAAFVYACMERGIEATVRKGGKF